MIFSFIIMHSLFWQVLKSNYRSGQRTSPPPKVGNEIMLWDFFWLARLHQWKNWTWCERFFSTFWGGKFVVHYGNPSFEVCIKVSRAQIEIEFASCGIIEWDNHNFRGELPTSVCFLQIWDLPSCFWTFYHTKSNNVSSTLGKMRETFIFRQSFVPNIKKPVRIWKNTPPCTTLVLRWRSEFVLSRNPPCKPNILTRKTDSHAEKKSFMNRIPTHVWRFLSVFCCFFQMFHFSSIPGNCFVFAFCPVWLQGISV